MILSIKAKSALAWTLNATAFLDWKLSRHSKNSFLILMYHRVIPATQKVPGVQAGMIVEPETFDMHLRFLKRKFHLVSLADLPGLGSGNKQKHPVPLCAITFDDGWCDFYEHAFPILKHYGAPATVFLPTGYIGTDHWFWTDRFGILLDRLMKQSAAGNRPPVLGDALLDRIIHLSGSYQAKLEKGIALLKSFTVDRIEQILMLMAEQTDGGTAALGRAFLSWSEVREMSLSGLVSFGSHTVDHHILTTLPLEAARRELTQSKADLVSQGVANSSFLPFSYPNGNYNEHLKQLVMASGYHLAVTTRNGWNQWGQNCFALRRIAIHEDITASEAMLASRLADVL